MISNPKIAQTVSNNVHPKFEVTFNENDVTIKQEEKIEKFLHEDIANISIVKGEINGIAIFLDFIAGLIFDSGTVLWRKNDQLRITTKDKIEHNFSLRYLEDKDKIALQKLVDRLET